MALHIQGLIHSATVEDMGWGGRGDLQLGHPHPHPAGKPQVSLQCQGDICKDKCSCADFRDMVTKGQ